MPHPKDLYVYVHSPLTERTADETYTSYAIFLTKKFPNFEKKMSHTRRRYKEFQALRNLLCKRHSSVTFTAFPEYLKTACFDPAVILHRKITLEGFLNEAVKYEEIIQDKLFQQFLQSSLSMQEIVKEFPEYAVDDAIQQWFRDSAPSAIHTFGRLGPRNRESPGPSTTASPGPSTRSSPGTSTRASPGTSTRASPGTRTRSSPGPRTRSSPGKRTRASLHPRI